MVGDHASWRKRFNYSIVNVNYVDLLYAPFLLMFQHRVRLHANRAQRARESAREREREFVIQPTQLIYDMRLEKSPSSGAGPCFFRTLTTPAALSSVLVRSCDFRNITIVSTPPLPGRVGTAAVRIEFSDHPNVNGTALPVQ